MIVGCFFSKGGKMNRICKFVVLIFLFTTLFTFINAQAPQKEWTIIYYMVSQNDPDVAEQKIVELEKIGSTSDVNFVVQYDAGEGNPAYRGKIERDVIGQENDVVDSTLLDPNAGTTEEGDNLDFTDQTVFENFIDWAIASYPAEHYMLVIKGHHDWAVGRETTKGVGGEGDWTGDPFIYAPAEFASKTIEGGIYNVVEGNATIPNGFEIVMFDAPKTNSIELAYAMYGTDLTDEAQQTDYFIGSNTMLPEMPYDKLFDAVNEYYDTDAATISENIVNNFSNITPADGEEYYNLISFDLSKMGAITTAIDSMANQFDANMTPNDLYKNEFKVLGDLEPEFYTNSINRTEIANDGAAMLLPWSTIYDYDDDHSGAVPGEQYYELASCDIDGDGVGYDVYFTGNILGDSMYVALGLSGNAHEAFYDANHNGVFDGGNEFWIVAHDYEYGAPFGYFIELYPDKNHDNLADLKYMSDHEYITGYPNYIGADLSGAADQLVSEFTRSENQSAMIPVREAARDIVLNSAHIGSLPDVLPEGLEIIGDPESMMDQTPTYTDANFSFLEDHLWDEFFDNVLLNDVTDPATPAAPVLGSITEDAEGKHFDVTIDNPLHVDPGDGSIVTGVKEYKLIEQAVYDFNFIDGAEEGNNFTDTTIPRELSGITVSSDDQRSGSNSYYAQVGPDDGYIYYVGDKISVDLTAYSDVSATITLYVKGSIYGDADYSWIEFIADDGTTQKSLWHSLNQWGVFGDSSAPVLTEGDGWQKIDLDVSDFVGESFDLIVNSNLLYVSSWPAYDYYYLDDISVTLNVNNDFTFDASGAIQGTLPNGYEQNNPYELTITKETDDNRQYNFYSKAVDKNYNESKSSTVVKPVGVTAPGLFKVANTTFASGELSMTLSWIDNALNNDGYLIQYWDEVTEAWVDSTEIADGDAQSTTISDIGGDPIYDATGYQFRIIAYVGSDYATATAESTPVDTTYTTEEIFKASELAVVAPADYDTLPGIRLTWMENWAETFDTYQVQWQNPEGDWVEIGTVAEGTDNPSVDVFQIGGNDLEVNTVYNFKLNLLDGETVVTTREVSFEKEGEVAAPGLPEDVTITQNDIFTATITWNNSYTRDSVTNEITGIDGGKVEKYYIFEKEDIDDGNYMVSKAIGTVDAHYAKDASGNYYIETSPEYEFVMDVTFDKTYELIVIAANNISYAGAEAKYSDFEDSTLYHNYTQSSFAPGVDQSVTMPSELFGYGNLILLLDTDIIDGEGNYQTDINDTVYMPYYSIDDGDPVVMDEVLSNRMFTLANKISLPEADGTHTIDFHYGDIDLTTASITYSVGTVGNETLTLNNLNLRAEKENKVIVSESVTDSQKTYTVMLKNNTPVEVTFPTTGKEKEVIVRKEGDGYKFVGTGNKAVIEESGVYTIAEDTEAPVLNSTELKQIGALRMAATLDIKDNLSGVNSAYVEVDGKRTYAEAINGKLAIDMSNVNTDDSKIKLVYSDKVGNENVEYVSASALGVVPQVNKTKLAQNYPNPFNPETDIDFAIPAPGKVKLVIYNSRGRVVETLVNEYINDSGIVTKHWDGKDKHGKEVASGVYYYTLIYNGKKIETKKMILLK